MLSAKHSTNVAQKDNNHRLVGPEATQPMLFSIDAGKFNIAKQCGVHTESLSRNR